MDTSLKNILEKLYFENKYLILAVC